MLQHCSQPILGRDVDFDRASVPTSWLVLDVELFMGFDSAVSYLTSLPYLNQFQLTPIGSDWLGQPASGLRMFATFLTPPNASTWKIIFASTPQARGIWLFGGDTGGTDPDVAMCRCWRTSSNCSTTTWETLPHYCCYCIPMPGEIQRANSGVESLLSLLCHFAKKPQTWKTYKLQVQIDVYSLYSCIFSNSTYYWQDTNMSLVNIIVYFGKTCGVSRFRL